MGLLKICWEFITGTPKEEREATLNEVAKTLTNNQEVVVRQEPVHYETCSTMTIENTYKP